MRRSQGFTVFELIVTLVLAGLVFSALFSGLIALVRSMQPQAVVISGETLPIAPTFGAFPSAVRLHQTLSDRAITARAIYVMGGSHLTIPSDAPETEVKPLAVEGLPAIDDFSAGLPQDARTFHELYADELGDQEPLGTSEDFTVIIVGPHENKLAVTCVIQARSLPVAVSDGVESTPFIVRDVKCWDITEGHLRYAFADRAALSSTTFIGAVHSWVRYKTGVVAEEGPASVVFPDPWLYAGARGRSDDIPPFSRFAYFFPVSP